MQRISQFCSLLLFVGILLYVSSCTDDSTNNDNSVVPHVESIEKRKVKSIEEAVRLAVQKHGRINDTVQLKMDSLVQRMYASNGFKPNWSRQETLTALADTLIAFVDRSKEYGLFPIDYHNRALHFFQQTFRSDSLARTNAPLWATADLVLTDAFLSLSKDLKQGRLRYDSVTLRTDTVLTDSFYTKVLSDLNSTRNVRSVLESLEPNHSGYDSLKIGLKFFLDSIQSFKRLTYINYPNKDSAALYRQLQLRFFEGDILLSPTERIDTAVWRATISEFQKSKGLKVTGKLNENTVLALNNTDWEKFKRIAITLDRYKQLPDTMPARYIWVNIPTYYMRLIEQDTVVFISRVVVGKPNTRTPLLTSRITDMITYPQWTIPTSIIAKEVIPGVKKNPAYFVKHDYSLIDEDGNVVDPATVNWQRYTKGIPYKVVQGSGDANALGILKFNFSNKYSVYLHDTNQRYLFKNALRSLSHGCVRVQEWQKLAQYLISVDSVTRKPNTSFIGTDSLKAWLSRKEKHYLPVRNRLPVFIRYFTCEGTNGKVKFFEDIYKEDKILRDRYFADKSIQ
ncbi:MAG: L,D-transpeptidase family protein [Chitinophagaceae bacterium]|nr:L,D-transpeptidase family protein [Chitinophagaceae bacterium]